MFVKSAFGLIIVSLNVKCFSWAVSKILSLSFQQFHYDTLMYGLASFFFFPKLFCMELFKDSYLKDRFCREVFSFTGLFPTWLQMLELN